MRRLLALLIADPKDSIGMVFVFTFILLAFALAGILDPGAGRP